MNAKNNNDYDDFGAEFDSSEGGETDAEKLDIQYYLRILRKHRAPIVLFSAIITALAAYYAYTAVPVYQATSTLLIESQRQSNVVSIEELIGSESESDDYYQTQFELLKSRRLAQRVVNHLDLWTNSELNRRFAADGDATTLTSDAPSIGKKIGGWFSFLTQSEFIPEDLEASGGRAETISPIAVEQAANRLFGPETTGAGLDMSEAERNSVIDAFMGRLSISPVRGTKLVHVSFESTNPEFAVTVANAVGEQYIDSYLDSKLEMTSRASDWLNDRLGDLKLDLDSSEDKLIKYKQENGLIDVNGSVGRLNEQELLLATTELAQARSELANASDLRAEVRSLRGQPALLEGLAAIQADTLVRQVKTELGTRQRELDELLNRYGAKHPRVVDANSRLESLSTTLRGHVNRVVGSIEKDFQLLQQRVVTIEAKLARGKDEILVLGTKRFELEELEREVATKRDLYNTFYSRITEANSTDGLDIANARISDLASVPSRPIKPKKQLIIALAGLASLMLSMLMALLYEQMDSSIKSLNDVEDRLGLKLLGILPLVKNGLFSSGSSSMPLVPMQTENKRGTFSESVNTIRTAIMMKDGKKGSKPRKVILITSSIPGEGKSTTSLNLAYSISQLERVLLIDCDMRRPSIAKALGIDEDAPGLTQLVLGTATASECIKRAVFDGYVDVLTTGQMMEHPLELLSSKRFEKVLQELSKYYDRIIIDSAPTQAVSDALVLSKLSDSVVYVAKSHETEINLVNRGVQRLRQVNAPIVGLIVSQVDVDKIVSYGGDYYYQGYYDYYGYNSNGETVNKLKLTKEELLEMKGDDRDVSLDLEFEMNRTYASDSMSYQDEEFELTRQFDSMSGGQQPEKSAPAPSQAPARPARPAPTKSDSDLDIL